MVASLICLNVPDPDLEMGGQSPKRLFSAFQASVWSKNKGEGALPPGPSPGSTSVQLISNTCLSRFDYVTV